jgi:uncharacterized membrane protein (UPF0127 family)
MKPLLRLLLPMVLLLPISGCAREPALPIVELKGRTYTVEIADDDAEHQQGLMFRREMAADHGMLFVFDRAAPRAFWMRNCEIALDIMYFDAQARFINAHYGVPPCRTAQCPNYPSKRPARYVVELNSGVGRALGLKEGDPLTLPASVPK